MPFSKSSEDHTEEYWMSHFETFLKPLIESLGSLEARRSQALRGDILREIINDLVVAKIVVADLTDSNANVYWELGVRQSFKHGTVTIAEASTKLPFDVWAKGTLRYHPKDHLKMAGFLKMFPQALKDCIDNPQRPDSQVLEVISGRGTLFELFRRDEAMRRIEAALSEADFNLDVMEEIRELASANQKNPSKRTFITSRFRLSAIELLTTNRYIEESLEFYAFAENCLAALATLNDQLTLWEHSPNDTEKWVLSVQAEFGGMLKSYEEKLEAVQGQLTKRI
jgi:hypothetical protein